MRIGFLGNVHHGKGYDAKEHDAHHTVSCR